MNDLLVRIKFQLPSLPRAEKIVAEELLDNPEAITDLTLAAMARETGSSEASIIRFCRRMGFNGYTELKHAFMKAVKEGDEVQSEEIKDHDDMRTILKKVFQSNIQTLNDTLSLATDNYDRALAALLKAKAIHFFGTGDAFSVCQLAYMKFSRLGIEGSAHSDVMLQLIAASNLKPDDVAFAVSYEGRSRNIVNAVKVAKEMGATTICITKMNKSPMLKYTDINLFTSISDLTVGRDKVTRRVSDQAILDALYLGYITKCGQKQNMSRYLKRVQNAIDCNKI